MDVALKWKTTLTLRTGSCDFCEAFGPVFDIEFICHSHPGISDEVVPYSVCFDCAVNWQEISETLFDLSGDWNADRETE